VGPALAPGALLPRCGRHEDRQCLLRQLNRDVSTLGSIDCMSFYCPWDLMVIPSWTGVLPIGPKQALPVWNHRQLIQSPRALRPVAEHLLQWSERWV